MRRTSIGQGVVIYAPMRDEWRDIGYRPNIGVRARPLGSSVDDLQKQLTKALEQTTEKLDQDSKTELRRINQELGKKVGLLEKGEFSLERTELDEQTVLISRFDGKHKVPSGDLLTRTRGIQFPDGKILYSLSFTFPLQDAEEMERVWTAFRSSLRIDEETNP